MAAFDPGSFVMVPHPEECFVAAKVKSGFKPGDAATVELLDGSVSESAACANLHMWLAPDGSEYLQV